MLKIQNKLVRSVYEDNDILKRYPSDTFYPYIVFNENKHIYDINEDVCINYYATNHFQTDYYDEIMDTKFTLIVNVDGEEDRIDITIGDNQLNLGRLSEGEHTYTLRVVDRKGFTSHSIYGELLVRDVGAHQSYIEENTAYISNDILTQYNVTIGDFTECTDANINITHVNKMGLQKLFVDYAKNYRKIVLPTAVYTVDVEGEWNLSVPGLALQDCLNVLCIPSNFTIDFNNSELRQLTSTPDAKVGWLFAMNSCYDSHILNGIFTGDFDKREFTPLEGYDYIPGEQGACCIISGHSKYCSIEHCTVKQFCGYAVCTGCQPKNLLIDMVDDYIYGDVFKFTSGTLVNGIQKESDYLYLTQMLPLEQFKVRNTFRMGQYLLNLYDPHGDSVLFKCHWYDEQQQYVKTTIEHQYFDIKIEENMHYVRGEYSFENVTTLPTNMNIYWMNTPRNCTFDNITFEDTRTCAMAPYQGNAINIINCTFARCGQTITPAAIDFEDGWHNMQDYCVMNCEILEPVGTTDIVIVGGFGLLFKNNTNWRISSREVARGQRFIDNVTPWINLGLSTHRKSAFCICKGNTVISPPGEPYGFIANTLGTLDDIKLIIDGSTFLGCVVDSTDSKSIYRNCILDWNDQTTTTRRSILSGKFIKCKFYNYIYNMGHVTNLEADRSELNNMIVEAISGDIILRKSKIDTFVFGNYNIDINIELTDCEINDMHFSRIPFVDKNNISIKFTNCTFTGNVYNRVISDGWANTTTTDRTFHVTVENCTFADGVSLASETVLQHSLITFDFK